MTLDFTWKGPSNVHIWCGFAIEIMCLIFPSLHIALNKKEFHDSGSSQRFKPKMKVLFVLCRLILNKNEEWGYHLPCHFMYHLKHSAYETEDK